MNSVWRKNAERFVNKHGGRRAKSHTFRSAFRLCVLTIEVDLSISISVDLGDHRLDLRLISAQDLLDLRRRELAVVVEIDLAECIPQALLLRRDLATNGGHEELLVR